MAGCTLDRDQAIDAAAEFEGLPEVSLDSLLGPPFEMRPVQNERTLVSRPTSLSIATDGSVVLADAGEVNVKLYPQGRPDPVVVGGEGDGPGELRRPLTAAFTRDSLLVGDTNAEVHVFTRSGEYQRRFVIEGLSNLWDLAATDDGGILVTGTATDPNESAVLFEVDPDGRIERHWLEARYTVPRGSPSEAEAWRPFRSFHVAVDQGFAFVTSTVSDSLWVADLESGTVARGRIPAPRYEGDLTVPPASAFFALTEFAEGLRYTYAPVPLGDIVLIPFVSGAGDDRTVRTVARLGDGRWVRVTTDDLILTGAAGPSVVGRRGEADDLVILLYSPRRPDL
ncbi:MAG: hypothetical protein RLN75_00080 [Longimicrobiales bacterium]